MADKMETSAAVLIVGAGPVGLTLAYALAAYQVPFEIIDAKPSATEQSKGLALNVSSLHGLSLLGLSDEIGQSGVNVSRFNVYWDNRLYSSINFNRLVFPVDYLVTQPQWKTEQELERALKDVGETVKWGRQLVSMDEQSDGSYEVGIESDGTIEGRTFQYVVGCDGKHSFVREVMGAKLSGVDYPMYMSLGDFQLDIDLPADQVHYFVYEETFFILVPIGDDGLWRIVTKHDGVIERPDFDIQITQQILSKYFGESIELGTPLWASQAQLYMRTADKIRQGNCFIAGDAAHLFSPIGGTGMNTGIQDALNLGWKLSMAYHETSDRSLLNTYEEERLAAIENAAGVADLSTRLITREAKEHPLIDRMALKISNRKFICDELPVLHSGLGVRVEPPSINDIQKGRLPVGAISRHFAQIMAQQKHTQMKPVVWANQIAITINLSVISAGDGDVMLGLLEAVKELPCVQLFGYCATGSDLPNNRLGIEAGGIVQKKDDPEADYAIQVIRPDGMCQSAWHIDEADQVVPAIIKDFHLVKSGIEQRTETQLEAV